MGKKNHVAKTACGSALNYEVSSYNLIKKKIFTNIIYQIEHLPI